MVEWKEQNIQKRYISASNTYPISNLVVFQACSSSIEHIDGTLLGA